MDRFTIGNADACFIGHDRQAKTTSAVTMAVTVVTDASRYSMMAIADDRNGGCDGCNGCLM